MAAGVWKEVIPLSPRCSSLFLFIQLGKGRACVLHSCKARRCLSRRRSPCVLAQRSLGHPLAWQECLNFAQNKHYYFLTATRGHLSQHPGLFRYCGKMVFVAILNPFWITFLYFMPHSGGAVGGIANHQLSKNIYNCNPHPPKSSSPLVRRKPYLFEGREKLDAHVPQLVPPHMLEQEGILL